MQASALTTLALAALIGVGVSGCSGGEQGAGEAQPQPTPQKAFRSPIPLGSGAPATSNRDSAPESGMRPTTFCCKPAQKRGGASAAPFNLIQNAYWKRPLNL
jgi:hypothetical protein